MMLDYEMKRQLTEALSLNNLTPDEQDEIIKGLMENAEIKIDATIADRLTKDEINQLNKLEEKDKQAYLAEKINNLPQLIQQSIKEIVEEFKELRAK